MNNIKSKKAFRDAQKYIPGGVNSPVRAFGNIGVPPLFIKKAEGASIFDIDGNEYVDYCLSWGVHILGHNHKEVIKSVLKTIVGGTSFGAPTLLETELAKRIVAAVPSIEMVRLVNSGTEAVMSAIRLARAFTGRDIIIKFDGCYHGHADHLLVNAGSGVSNLYRSSSKGVPEGFLQNTISLPFNNIDAVKEIFRQQHNKIAAIIVEPVPANMGVIIPRDGYLEYLRNITEKNGALLIFDEIITGFRWHIRGAQGYFGIKPDLTVLGKIIGGGFPVGAFGGRKEIMNLLAPAGPVYQAGTLSGNPIAMAAGIAVLDALAKKGFYDKLNEISNHFFKGITAVFKGKKIAVNSLGTMFSIFFTDSPVEDYAGLMRCDKKKFAKFYRQMLDQGIYFSPAQGEADFISVKHTPQILAKTLSSLSK
ncbi:MAG: glutamate-1-semialdehyde-2,1-aminomutase [Elusimicrobia bacterium RIFOXYA2_FULL_40_6]|nr:MAG: glutamate-1-semialdehyde-2,1-aminomutase [Elusimicrobia bacterium RIFOXYA2_FULL_40_6]